MKKIVSLLIVMMLFVGILPVIPASAAEIIITSNTKGYSEESIEGGTIDASSLMDALEKNSRYAFGNGDKFIYTPDIPADGEYEVFYYVIKHDTNSAEQKVIVTYKDGQKELKVDCVNQTGWVSLGKYQFKKGTSGNVTSVREGETKSTPYMRTGGVKIAGDAIVGESVNLIEPTPRPTPEVQYGPKLEPKELIVPAKRGNFTDITDDYSWAKDAIEILAGAQIINGVGEGLFDPSAPITRAEFIKLAVGVAGLEPADYADDYTDVTKDKWYANYLKAAKESGLIDDAMVTDGAINPEDAITREEMTSIIVKSYEKITEGEAPKTGEEFADADEIAPWAQGYVKGAVALGIIKGVGNNRFAPKDNADRGQAAVIVDRLMRSAKAKDGVFLSTAGNDEEDGSLSAPVATLGRAVEIAKDKGGATIYVFAGTYEFDDAVVIDADDISVVAFEHTAPVFSGGKKVTGWEKHDGNIYKATVEGVEDFRQLYIDDVRAIRGRFPNEGETIATVKTNDNTNFFLPADKYAPIANVLENASKYPSQLELNTTKTWMHKILRITDVVKDGADYRVFLNDIEWNAMMTGPQGNKNFASAPTWIENAYEFVDAPYEWYFDKGTKTVYVYAPEGVDLNQAEVIVPKAESIVKLTGTLDKPINNIIIDGITFKHSGWTRPNYYGFVDVQANSILPIPENMKEDVQFRHNQKKDKLPGALYANYANNVDIRNCVFTKLGANGITFDLGGQNVTIDGNVVFDVAGNGIEIGNDAIKPSNENMLARNVAIRNNYVRNVSYGYKGGIGIMVMYCDSAVVSHNEVVDVPYTGINISWGWEGVAEAPIFTKDFTIENNRIEKYAQVTNDTGAIYSPNPSYGTNVLRGNYITGDYLGMTDRMITGIYHDSNAGNWEDYDNVVEFVKNWTGMSGSSTEKHNITSHNNFVTVVEKDASLSGDYVFVKDNTTMEAGKYPQKALDIIENAGLQPEFEYLKNIPAGEIIVDMLTPWVEIGAEKTFDISFKLKNTLGKNVAVNLKGREGNKLFNNTETVELKPYEEKTIKWTCEGTDTLQEGSHREYIVVECLGKKQFAYTGVLKTIRAEGLFVLPITSEHFQKLGGNWDGSGLVGYNNDKTIYGYGKDASAGWFNIDIKGTYKTAFYNVNNPTATKALEIKVVHANGEEIKVIDQSAIESGWIELGKFEFKGDAKEGIYVTDKNTQGGEQFPRLSAVKFEILK